MPWLWESDRFPRGSLQVDHAKKPLSCIILGGGCTQVVDDKKAGSVTTVV